MVTTRSVRPGQGQPQYPNNPPPQLPNTFPPVEHVEGGDENQPHDSAHNSAHTINHGDAVTAQLAAMQQQFRIFQLVLAQLLARNNPADPLINLLNPAQPQHPPIPPQEPPPIPHNEPQHAPVINSLERLVAEQRGAPPPHHDTASIPHPLNTNITLEPYPPGFKILQLETYDGTKDPDDHLHAFYSCMQTQNASDALMCKIFPSTLRVNSFDQAVGIAAVISGLNHERFRDSLIKHPATTFNEVNDRSLKFITAEEYALSQKPIPSKNQNPNWREENQSRKRMRTVLNQGPMSNSTPRFGRPNSTPPPPQLVPSKPPVTWTPFNLPRSQIFMQIKNKMDLRHPGPMRSSPATRDHTKYCDFHQDHGHTTKQCNSLRSELESLAEKGMLNEYIQRLEQSRLNDDEWKDQPITFTPVDFEGVVTPHNDPLVTFVMINNCQVQRVLVDTSSAPDIMYYHCFESLGLDSALLQKYDGPIYGFNNQPVQVEGVLTLNVAFGSGRTYVTPSVLFLVVKMPSSFNIVIGRPTLTEIRAVVSQSHLCMKFPTPMGIATLKDNKLEDESRTALVEDVEETLVDMPGIPTSVAQHKLSTNPLKKPVPQKRHLFRGGEVIGHKRRVLVKKSNGKWRMCIDYTNLNQACPKDCYPMPNIDKLVEAASGNERLSLLDVYSGYHQVPMAPKDQEKTSFYAGDEIYCYMMMPFGLKNAGATYQKMVTIVFRAQIGWNLEVYVDDIVAKSLKAEDHLVDLDETFNNLRKNRMRLNPTKCIFDVKSGKFLGFMVSRRGIEVNLEKIKVVAEMEPPKSVKDVQRLTGRVAALHRFISKSADKSAFDELKFYLSSPPLLTKAVDGEILYLYLGISDEAISFVLRSAIRAQALADFIVECTSAHTDPQPEPDSWTLYVDGASSSKGSGAGAILLGPEGYRSEYALKFNFEATNIMAEYEALLLGLQLALELKVAAIQIYSDSQLVVNQVNSVCEVVDPVMMKYATMVAELKSKFQKFCLSKIPRAENEQADSLSKFASDGSQSSRSVFVEILNEPSFQKPKMMEISTNPDTPSWTDPIISFLRDGTVSANKHEEMRLRKKASRYTLVHGALYKRSFSLPLLRCLSPYEAEYALHEVHEGVCGSHISARTLAHKILRQGYYWPNMYKDATQFIQRCSKCQFFTHLTHQPAKELTDLVAPWPFAQWGLDLLGPFMKGIYGILNQIVADNGTQFNCSSFRDFCSSYGIKLQFTSVYHPESNGMVESVNKAILEGIKPRLEQHKARWVDELNNVL
ncbi:hypothetical protein SLEP1_g45572 [Rubroshorea leprosula]|uniref:Uncharacterized protein n=1 Tax=Rubroshorea leprosula TaxID=152421 RepID=A0AAV5LJH0_9ROSI|nr:hypothetical protein SLEP1_g45572 [Rubroshorea leprosula]